MNSIIQHVCQAASVGLTDRELLDVLAIRRDEAAFEALLRRHGPMVLAICRKVLGDLHEAEDAFQATFLVLIRKAATIRKREAVASWLCGVAYRTARKARVMNANRRVKEMQAAKRPRPNEAEPDVDLDVELNALPEKYRLPVVLCELESRSRKEVARQLNIPEGTLSSRLATARRMLAQRLRRRGCTFATVAPVVASVPALLIAATVKAAGPVLAGRGMTGVVSANVIALTEGVVRAMFVTKLKALTAVLVVLGALGLCTHQLVSLALAADPAAAAKEQPQRTPEEVQKAAADLAAAKAALKQAEANLAAAQSQVLRAEAAYRAARSGEKGENGVAATALVARFKYQIKFETGLTETTEGGKIEIAEVWGTRPKIEVGGQYLVRGKYVLPKGERGTLYFYETAEGDWGLAGSTTLDLQSTAVDKQEGEFTLVHGMAGPGYFHLVLADPERYSRMFANVYFGTGDNVWRKKQ